jgi:hypothetical protein
LMHFYKICGRLQVPKLHAANGRGGVRTAPPPPALRAFREDIERRRQASVRAQTAVMLTRLQQQFYPPPCPSRLLSVAACAANRPAPWIQSSALADEGSGRWITYRTWRLRAAKSTWSVRPAAAQVHSSLGRSSARSRQRART